jgi:hypothetical protein
MEFSKALNRLGETALVREDTKDYGSDDIGAAFTQFSVVTKELSNLMKNLVSGKKQTKKRRKMSDDPYCDTGHTNPFSQ